MFKFLLFSIGLALGISKAEYYVAMSSADKVKIEAFEKKLAALPHSEEQQAFLGAIRMKYADNQKNPLEKLNMFKEGKEMLEKSIQSNHSNIEYRFLRLMIQENAPKFLKYYSNIEEDVKLIKSHLDIASKETKHAIQQYAKKSQNLKL